jgi:hypothetical protein
MSFTTTVTEGYPTTTSKRMGSGKTYKFFAERWKIKGLELDDIFFYKAKSPVIYFSS